MSNFLLEIAHYSWFTAFLASLFGGIIALVFQPLTAKINKRSDLAARAWERIQDRRLDAYETLLSISKTMKTTVATGDHDQGFVDTIPSVLCSKLDYQNWRASFVDAQDSWESWVDLSTSQHMRYLVDYHTNLMVAVIKTPDDEILELAKSVKPDLISLAAETQKVAHKFLQNIDKKNLIYSGNGKYSLKKTNKLLGATNLIRWMTEKGQLSKDGEEMPSFGLIDTNH